MRRLFLMVITAHLVFACNQEHNDYTKISGKISNFKEDTEITLIRFKDTTEAPRRTIKINEDGTFKDTIQVKDYETFIFKLNNNWLQFHAGEDFDLNLTIDADNPRETIHFEGKGSEYSIYVMKKNKWLAENYQTLISNVISEKQFRDKALYATRFDSIKKAFDVFQSANPSLSSDYLNNQKESFEKFTNEGLKYLDDLRIQDKLAGSPSPKFSYIDINDNIVKLDDLKGKYVFIDVWATWCGPCIKEIPYLKELEHKFRDKDIQFVSISIDKLKDKEKWKNMVIEKQLTGVQLLADNDWNSDFVKGYMIKGIPAFILIDPNGIIIDPMAPKPSNSKLIKLFNEAGI